MGEALYPVVRQGQGRSWRRRVLFARSEGAEDGYFSPVRINLDLNPLWNQERLRIVWNHDFLKLDFHKVANQLAPAKRLYNGRERQAAGLKRKVL
jgi:hypothetical protein